MSIMLYNPGSVYRCACLLCYTILVASVGAVTCPKMAFVFKIPLSSPYESTILMRYGVYIKYNIIELIVE